VRQRFDDWHAGLLDLTFLLNPPLEKPLKLKNPLENPLEVGEDSGLRVFIFNRVFSIFKKHNCREG
jgi:hypothetical protein